MKRIKAMNGYTIYEVTERDEKRGNGTAGEYAIYFTSDVRDYGVAYSYPEYDGIDSLEVAEELCTGNYAIAKEIAEQATTAASFEEIEEIEKTLDTLSANMTEQDIFDALRRGNVEDVLSYLGRSHLIYAVREGWMTLDDATATYEYIMNI